MIVVSLSSLTLFATAVHSRILKLSQSTTDKKTDNEISTKPISLVEKVVKVLALQENYKSLSADVSTRVLPSIDGFRVVLMSWVILGHAFYFSLSSVDNMKNSFAYNDAWVLQFFYASVSSVDVFFLISGLLFAYNFSEKLKKNPTGNLLISCIKKIVKSFFQVNLGFGIVS